MRNKLKRFEENRLRRNVIEAGKPLLDSIQGNWHSLFFGNNNPITLELACGKGEYTVGLAKHYPNRNFVGVDIKGARLYFGSREAEEEGLQNVAFLRIKILDISQHFSANEVDELWITFPDPRPRDSDEHRRLTHPRYLSMYQQLLREGGIFHLKTDDPAFFEFSLEMLQQFNVTNLEWTNDLYNSPLLAGHHGLQTNYEQKYLAQGKAIHYLRCAFWKETLDQSSTSKASSTSASSSKSL